MRSIFNKNFNIKLNYFIFLIFIIIFLYSDVNGVFSNFKEYYINKKIYIIYNCLNYANYLINNFRNFFINKNNLLKYNNELKKELNIEKSKNLLFDFYKKENDELKNILKIKKNKHKIVLSKVIKKDYSNNILIIDKGINNNINLGFPVLNEDGIIGQIIKIEKNFSHVLLTSSKKHYISVKILRNNIKLILRGSGYKNEFYIYNDIDIVDNKDIETNDLLITSGLDNKFPEGFPVGIIKKVNICNNKIKKICIKSIFNNKHINYVFILKNKNIYLDT